MKYIKFCDEIVSVPEDISFWIQIRGKEYAYPYCVNMSFLERQNFAGEPTIDSIIRSEGYITESEADDRLDEIFALLTKK